MKPETYDSIAKWTTRIAIGTAALIIARAVYMGGLSFGSGINLALLIVSLYMVADSQKRWRELTALRAKIAVMPANDSFELTRHVVLSFDAALTISGLDRETALKRCEEISEVIRTEGKPTPEQLSFMAALVEGSKTAQKGSLSV